MKADDDAIRRQNERLRADLAAVVVAFNVYRNAESCVRKRARAAAIIDSVAADLKNSRYDQDERGSNHGATQR